MDDFLIDKDFTDCWNQTKLRNICVKEIVNFGDILAIIHLYIWMEFIVKFFDAINKWCYAVVL